MSIRVNNGCDSGTLHIKKVRHIRALFVCVARNHLRELRLVVLLTFSFKFPTKNLTDNQVTFEI